MELGEKLRKARLDAGLSQRQLCGNEITRNMLSQIENGSAKPSMKTLQYLAKQLSLPISYFMGEEGTISPNSSCIRDAWCFFEAGEPASVLECLRDYRSPDAVYDREYHLLHYLSLLAYAEKSIEEGKSIRGRQLLIEAENIEESILWLPEVKTRRIRLLARLGAPVSMESIPDLDAFLYLQALAAYRAEDYDRGATLLDASQNRSASQWCLLRGRMEMAKKSYEAAIRFISPAEASSPKDAIPLLEECYRELGDFKTAYQYACKSRDIL